MTILLFFVFIYECPVNFFFHFPCPGCGLTRAYIAALHFDIKKAFEYHPLFVVVAPMLLYVIHRNALKKHFSSTTEYILLLIFLVLFIAVYILRLLKFTLVSY